jgi:hypothetical protein
MPDLEIVNPVELREEQLLQLLAVFIRRFGGEVHITEREFAMVEGIPVIAQQVTPEDLRLRLDEGEFYAEFPIDYAE